MSDHTPTPWVDAEWCNKHDGWHVQNEDGGTYILLSSPNSEDVPFILRACSAHEALIEALERIRKHVGYNGRTMREETVEKWCVEALRLARGEVTQ